MSKSDNPPRPTETRQPAQQPPGEERAIAGGGVMQLVDTVGKIGEGVGGIAGAAYVVKHWNDRPGDMPHASAAPPPASPSAEAPKPETQPDG